MDMTEAMNEKLVIFRDKPKRHGDITSVAHPDSDRDAIASALRTWLAGPPDARLRAIEYDGMQCIPGYIARSTDRLPTRLGGDAGHCVITDIRVIYKEPFASTREMWAGYNSKDINYRGLIGDAGVPFRQFVRLSSCSREKLLEILRDDAVARVELHTNRFQPPLTEEEIGDIVTKLRGKLQPAHEPDMETLGENHWPELVKWLRHLPRDAHFPSGFVFEDPAPSTGYIAMFSFVVPRDRVDAVVLFLQESGVLCEIPAQDEIGREARIAVRPPGMTPDALAYVAQSQDILSVEISAFQAMRMGAGRAASGGHGRG